MTQDYKDTLNLPKTDFPMKANLAQREPKMLSFWHDIKLYQTIQQARSTAKKFILADGPPYANGNIHIGHALNKILKDIIIKAKTLNGYLSPYIPGWDCHGLPIELQVEKKIGKPGDKVDFKTFRQKCREYANKQINVQKESFKRLGVLGDWDNPYITMDYKFEANIIRTLGKIIANKHLTQGDKPVHWCVNCGSALAEAEVEYKDKTSPSIYVEFTAVDPLAMADLFACTITTPVSMLVWTTTPWTLPANEAVCLNKDAEYILINLKAQQKNLIIAKELLEPIVDKLAINIEDVEILGKCLGAKLESTTPSLQHPFYSKTVPIILGDHVTLDAGTGCVHTAPAHGNDDYIIGKAYKLKINNPVDSNGCFLENTPELAGMHVFKANVKIIEILQQHGKLLNNTELLHSYPHCWRHKTPLIFRATKQWFISMEQNKLKEQTLAAIEDVKWIPDWGQARIKLMVDGRPDWCISRQRTWGTPIPLLVHKITGELHPQTAELIEQVAVMVEKDGIDAWYEMPIEELISNLAGNSQNCMQYEKVTDSLDVWFDSGAVHACVAEQRAEINSDVVDLYLEGSDQHRGWFQTSLLSAVAIKQHAPYKQVLTHGFTVDADGRKMSKSLGNVVAPEQVIKTLGADVLRLWVAATDYRNELHVSNEILKRTSDAYRRIRNTARFLLANLHGFDFQQHLVAAENMLMLDRWIVDRASKLHQSIIQAYENYQFHIIYQRVHNFCVNELGSFYLDIIKDRQYTCKTDGIPRRSAQTALYYITHALVRWIAPILSFTAEEIWQHLPDNSDQAQSVFLTNWSDFQLATLPDNITMNDAFWEEMLLIRSCINKMLENSRKEGIIGSGLEAEVTLYCSGVLLTKLQALQDELRFVLITSQALVIESKQLPDNALKNDIENLYISIEKSVHPKCARCWHRRQDVGKDKSFSNICSRCIENLSTVGEQRVYA